MRTLTGREEEGLHDEGVDEKNGRGEDDGLQYISLDMYSDHAGGGRANLEVGEEQCELMTRSNYAQHILLVCFETTACRQLTSIRQ